MFPAGLHIARRTRRRSSTLALAAATLLLGSTAGAQTPGFYSEHFEPLPSQGLNLLNLGTSHVLEHLYPSAGLFVQYLDDPLQLVTDNASEDVVSQLIEHQLRADLWLSMGFADFLELGVVVPLVLNQSGGDLTIFARPSETVDAIAMGDIRVVPKLRLFGGESTAGFGMAFLFDLSIPTGSRGDFTSDGELRFSPRVVLDWTHADTGFSVVANVGYHLRPKTTINNLVIDDALTWGGGVRVPTPWDELKVAATVFGSIPFDENVDPITQAERSDSRTTPIEIDGAFELTLDDFVLQAGGGAGLSEGIGAPDFRLFLSFGYVPRCDDRDGDLICRGDDACPDQPEDFDGFEDDDGCPDLDNDRDGVADLKDGELDRTGFGRCRDIPEDMDGFVDADGCPEADNDNDGVPDVSDGEDDPALPGFGRCRDLPEDVDGFRDTDGCPEEDNDGDGVADAEDGPLDPNSPGFGRCRGIDSDAPDFAGSREDVDGFRDEDGCLDADNDQDGVPDTQDGPLYDPDFPAYGVCRDGAGPTEKELRDKGFAPPWRYKDPETVWPGCHAVPTPRCQCGKLQIPYKINFRYNRASLTPASQGILDEVAKILLEKPCIAKLRVEGHTDWKGSERYNNGLSERRAQSVVDYLVKRGLPRDHFEIAGYGERWPIDPGDKFHEKVCRRCSDGCTCEVGSAKYPDPNEGTVRAENRRSVFRVLELRDPDGTVKQCKMPYASP